ncbi:MAG: menaquinone biosynthesis decarboxylase [Acidobacteriota bacterium]|nr:menaquinone biosynthesis decarboxylase [Blastocatellia bacterium]MDW8412274.1 menaquinone biosynthesis decarboxylase [Acidobacteriota bacterium]
MAYRDLREFIEALEREGELKRIKVEVSQDLEISEITDRVCKMGGPALLFENVKGHSMPVLINAFGSRRRMELALGVRSLEEVAERIAEWLDFKSPQGLLEKIKLLPKLAELGSFFPKVVKTGRCKEMVLREGFSLYDFPILKCWPEDGGRYITLPLVFSKNPVNGKRNCGMYRMQVYDERTTGMHWQLHKHGAAHFREHSRRTSQPMEVAVAIGTEPVTTFAAILPLPDDLDEMLFAGFLRRSPVEMVKCETVDLEVPADAEIVLEGYVDPNETRVEGPFGDHTGFYTLQDSYPVFHITCITRRRDPIYSTTIVGRPPMEDCYMAEAIERIFLPIFKRQFPEVVDMHMPFEGVVHNLMILSIRKAYPGHARKIMNAVWGLGQAMFTKCIIVVDEHIDVRDYRQVAWYVLNNIDPERDIQFVMGPVDVLDHASRSPAYGSKMGIDGTKKWSSEGFTRPWPSEIRMDEEVKRLVDFKWKDLGLG